MGCHVFSVACDLPVAVKETLTLLKENRTYGGYALEILVLCQICTAVLSI